jgi:type VI secretion system protein VasD
LARELAWSTRPTARAIGRRGVVKRLLLAAMPAGAGVLLGCKSGPPPVARVSGHISAAPGVNLSVSQRPSPLRLRLYELKSATAFNQADFMALYQSDQATLGPDVLSREEFVLQPDEARPYAKVLAPETRYLGVVALYRDLERATWRAVAAVQPGKAHTLQIRADSQAVSMTVQ